MRETTARPEAAHGGGAQRRHSFGLGWCGLAAAIAPLARRRRRARGRRPRIGAARSAATLPGFGWTMLATGQEIEGDARTRAARSTAIFSGGTGLGDDAGSRDAATRGARETRARPEAALWGRRAAPPFSSTRVEGSQRWRGRLLCRDTRGRPRGGRRVAPPFN
ncbi:hypothetical protein BD626DRAFT_577239 [Schizophyllum amplum]|uniref:Uncharacterized protein n=1 Tax=Schizophyllum amplum TaxID=97359 RepID=A0A550BSP2_9AGAR|nr:hypothetical protein BD626DRAFT_577239 [Auriculariopsis ampla]